MSGVKRLEHATLRVTDLSEAVDFYTAVLGLVELERDDGVVYLGCGLDDNYDLGLVDGGTGVEHFALRVDDAETVARFEDRLAEAGVDTQRTDGVEPNQEAGVRFTLPGGVDMEYVTVADTAYHHPTRQHEDRLEVAPRDADHINLMSDAPDEDRDFLTDHAGFAASDVVVDDESTVQAWLRYDEFHHDAGLTRTAAPGETLHHYAFGLDSLEHVKAVCDRLSAHGYRLEYGPSRHNAGANLFAYVWGPGGNRIELSAEMATLDDDAPVGVRELSEEENTVSRWGGPAPPESFFEEGS
jgi:catechol 2,3-dioxygenase